VYSEPRRPEFLWTVKIILLIQVLLPNGYKTDRFGDLLNLLWLAVLEEVNRNRLLQRKRHIW
jgi:hypothetical protein